MSKPKTLPEWIRAYGRQRLAYDLGCTWSAADHWMRGRRTPEPHHALRISEMSGIPLETILGGKR